jgi:hypothetical protein
MEVGLDVEMFEGINRKAIESSRIQFSQASLFAPQYDYSVNE